MFFPLFSLVQKVRPKFQTHKCYNGKQLTWWAILNRVWQAFVLELRERETGRQIMIWYNMRERKRKKERERGFLCGCSLVSEWLESILKKTGWPHTISPRGTGHWLRFLGNKGFLCEGHFLFSVLHKTDTGLKTITPGDHIPKATCPPKDVRVRCCSLCLSDGFTVTI